jgi:Zn-dependent metalloprotease
MDNIPHACGFIPAHLLRHVADHGTPEHADAALTTLDQMQIVVQDRQRALIPPVVTVSPGKKRRNVYDAGRRRTLPGKLVLSEHKKRPSDVDVNEAYDGAGATYDFYALIFGFDSIDGRGGRIDSSVHYGVRFANAMWTGTQIVYGDGDGQLFGRFTASLDVIGHELTHAVTQHIAGLIYSGQSGALNEHMSDVIGTLVRQFQLGQSAAEADWLIGSGLLTKSVHGRAIRSMAAPGTAYDDPILGRDPQPWHMRDYVESVADNGGIHINSGIPNHAFYRVATAIGGNAWNVPGKIWFETLKRLKPTDGFQRFADTTTKVAGDLFGIGGREQASVSAAWNWVGLPPSPGLTPRLVIKAGDDADAGAPNGIVKWRKRPARATR